MIEGEAQQTILASIGTIAREGKVNRAIILPHRNQPMASTRSAAGDPDNSITAPLTQLSEGNPGVEYRLIPHICETGERTAKPDWSMAHAWLKGGCSKQP